MDEKKLKAIDKVKEEIAKIDKKEGNVFFFVLDTKGVPSGSLEYIYKLALIAKNDGYKVGMLYQLEKEDEFVGVEEWLGKTYSELPHYNVSKDEVEITPSDIVFIPEIFSQVMNQTKKLPCKRVAILQNYNYLLEQMPFAAQWGDFAILDCLANTQYNAELIKDIFPYVRTTVVTPYIDKMFGSTIEPKKMVINIVAKNQSDINKIIKPFYWKFPTFKWVSFRDLRGFPKEAFANALRDAAATIWVDEDTSFGYSAIEAMKSGSIVIAKVPENPLEWIDSDDDKHTLRNCCVWFDNFNNLHRQIASVVRSFITDNIPPEVAEEAKKVTELYSEEKTTKEMLDYLKALFDGRRRELEALIRKVESEENNEEKSKK
jgi:hypothetical protein